ncbi:Uncharacterised protein [Mycobacteroides abscessus subsp. abscessus]|nr:Uncharacterised protein [Mycobacteroides abscessus subsp. abscessus]SHV53067.1 Uncharacterised protein [Mycobacteroides abscessus subsp. abscessus]SIH42074.1 Uncharacterised protein [Mycobacteroides abscessus subsp. abscessus]SII35744.1 Uncharacterised protein [Mycobacteroides abscessus subsp. abscessus]SKP57961.1 Uncharacterised protein [Mycobacteroides abscessus subsp. abscessus]
MSTVLIAPIIGSIALCVAIAGWDAAVFARRHFEQPRERLIAWARECGEAFELLVSSRCEMLGKQEKPPVRYGLRAYLFFDLIGDLEELDNFSRDGRWGGPRFLWPIRRALRRSSRPIRWGLQQYVEPRIVTPIARAIVLTRWRWSAERTGKFDDKTPTLDEVNDAVTYGFQRVGMLQRHVLEHERMPWIATMFWRVRIYRRIRRRREQREARWRQSGRGEWSSSDVGVPL